MTMMVQKLGCLKVQLELKSSDIVSLAFILEHFLQYFLILEHENTWSLGSV